MTETMKLPNGNVIKLGGYGVTRGGCKVGQIGAAHMKKLLMIATVMLLPITAYAEPECMARAILVEQLAENFKEAPQFVGLDNSGNLLEVWVSHDNPSWTVLVSYPERVSCLLAVGSNFSLFQTLKPQL